MIHDLIAKLASIAIMMFARALTAARAIWHETGLPPRQSIYFANHSSHGDFVLIWAVLPPWLRARARPVAGAEYWLKSKLSTFIGRDVFDAVLIERDPAARTQDPVELMATVLGDGASLIVFPEGTRNQTEARLLPFKSGLYHLACKRPDVALVPVWINNLNRVMPKGEFVPIPLICTVTFGEPMHLKAQEAKDEFIARAEAALLLLAPPTTEDDA
ncbi:MULTISPECIES: lysophospholipid acyltransferase family protein [unclassified Ensifer]|uniref:lysophospholipid acyltransferase family protein n=1 Tax=unclassified Ensifer TaxID=2633371 RepID=UPI0008134B16|nr:MULTISPECIES: lysophospholipid acyltransferase family protein [unclassified Ensifer]OCP00869.1 acyl-phosphate glycerol 3-phosphate acyltransferase [Ensifer sp. LC11]OCP01437.1 acyl-phosphate glycerol 3-phosphate acyltransferase [Ensifer sp. LC13]OCP01985.1 acyl-phosphate glycerol 3-phosphate acyltransferase [Ensifer sp. LC14]OCP30183.1 acyl-phosphate glycerol 3-phosphate acyltransferase [Ensifer sp. LC499]